MQPVELNVRTRKVHGKWCHYLNAMIFTILHFLLDKLGLDINSESFQDYLLLNKTIIIEIDRLQALYFDKIHGKIGKRVVAKETPCIAMEHHVRGTLRQSPSSLWFFPALGTLGRPG